MPDSGGRRGQTKSETYGPDGECSLITLGLFYRNKEQVLTPPSQDLCIFTELNCSFNKTSVLASADEFP